MSDAKMTGFQHQVFESVEMMHQTPDHRDIERNGDTYISSVPPISGKVAPVMRHPNTINTLGAKQRHYVVMFASRDILSMRALKRREKKSLKRNARLQQKRGHHSGCGRGR